jgi:hypothetical protein
MYAEHKRKEDDERQRIEDHAGSPDETALQPTAASFDSSSGRLVIFAYPHTKSAGTPVSAVSRVGKTAKSVRSQ